MLRSNTGRAVRGLRHRRGWRQSDLSTRAGVSREAVSRLERGMLRGMTVGTIESILQPLDATLDVVARWKGADLDRLTDALHAALQDEVARALTALGWLVRVEVSFNHFGDRGRVDVVAFHPPARVVLVIEVKSALGDLQETLGRLDVKRRLGRQIAGQCGWTDVGPVLPALVIRDSRAARRVVAAHDALFARFSCRGRQALAWLRRPAGSAPTGFLWFARTPDSRDVTAGRRRRVRRG